jgi:DNA polymerase elongation subunit (family B)
MGRSGSVLAMIPNLASPATSIPCDTGWDETPGIVSVWADVEGRAFVWRRIPETGRLVHERVRFRPWILIDRKDYVTGLPAELERTAAAVRLRVRELDGPGALRYVVRADSGRVLRSIVLHGAARHLGRPVDSLRELGKSSVLALPPDEQYLVASGRTYFRDLPFDGLRRMQIDLETTGLDADRDRIFLIATRRPDGTTALLEASGDGDEAEAALIASLADAVRSADPDVIENHNLHGFDLPFLDRRARQLGVALTLGRLALPLRERTARRGVASDGDARRRVRLVAPGRELIDTMDAVLRHGFATSDLKEHGLKAVARHFGISGPERERVPGDRIYEVFRRDPDRVRRYAAADVAEVADLARIVGGAPFALARMVPRRYERLADAGAATGIIDPLLVRAYLRAGTALPAHQPDDRGPHTGAALHVFATGVARRVVKADVASLYPSLMRAFRIGPARDHLGALVALVDRLVERRLQAKASARAAPPGSAERHTYEALSAAMKLVVNSAYGYLAAGGGLTRFADVHAANEVTRRGRETLALMCRELAGRGVTLLEADTDGVYFAVPDSWCEADERRVVSEVAALLPPLVQLEFEGRYAAMLSHEPKNYALAGYDGSLILRGVAFRSSRAEPFGEAFLRRALACLLAGDVAGVRDAYVTAVAALRRRELSCFDVSSRTRLTKSPAAYLAVRDERRELPYEALLASGRTTWTIGERIRVYRTGAGTGAIVADQADTGSGTAASDPRDYDVEHYVRVLRDTFASRLERSFTEPDFAALVADPGQPPLFATSFAAIQPVLTPTSAVP